MALTLMVAAGLALALWGGKGSAWARTSDGLELLYPHFPPAAEPGTSWQMMIARVLLPVVALYATLRFVVSFYTQRLRLFRLGERFEPLGFCDGSGSLGHRTAAILRK